MILNTGDIPNLYENEDRLAIIERVIKDAPQTVQFFHDLDFDFIDLENLTLILNPLCRLKCLIVTST